MRFGRWGLPLLTTLALLGPMVAHAADEGSAGVVEDVVVVKAHETLPGERSGTNAECTYEVVIEDDDYHPVYSADGIRQYSDTGRWLRKICDGEVVNVGGSFVFPEGAGYNTPDLLDQAIDLLDPDPPSWGASPDGVAVAMVTQMPTSLWVEPSYWDGSFVVRAESASGRVWAEARAVPTATTWHPGDGRQVACAGSGEPPIDAAPTSCSHVFERSTAGAAGFAMTVTVTFEVVGTTSDNASPTVVGEISRTSPAVLVTVGEIQAIETAGG